MEYKVALSYAGEDRRFIKYIAEILERYMGKDFVFWYSKVNESDTETNTRTITEFLKFINESLDNNVLQRNNYQNIEIIMVCFTRWINGVSKVKVAQQTELLDRGNAGHNDLCPWQVITNRNKLFHNVKTIFVALPDHGLNDQQRDEWAIRCDTAAFGQSIHDYGRVLDLDRSSAESIAEYIIRNILGMTAETHSCKYFTYEKDAIKLYSELRRDLNNETFVTLDDDKKVYYQEKFNEGVPLIWPTVRLRTDKERKDNELVTNDRIGYARPGLGPLITGQDDVNEIERVVVSSALSEHHNCKNLHNDVDSCMIRSNLCFPEAGPRSRIMDINPRVGIVVGGGIAPGINAVIDGIVRRHEDYGPTGRITGFKYGFWGLCENGVNIADNSYELYSDQNRMPRGDNKLKTAEYVSRGGSMLGTYRLNDLNTRRNLRSVMINLQEFDILYLIGGDGTMKAANLLANVARQESLPISIIGIPKTTDNDILWVWQSFGFATAVEKAREIINCLSIEVQSNPRICVIQLFGSVSGFVVSHAVLSSDSGQCDAALIPESKFRIKALAEKLLKNFKRKNIWSMPYGLIVMAETAIPEDANDYKDDAGLTDDEELALNNFQNNTPPGGYMDGQTSDELRSASLKLVVAGIRKELENNCINQNDRKKIRIFTNEPRHILRATNPSFADIIMGQRLGTLAVDNAMAGYSNFMVSQWLTEYVLVPLRMVASGRKRIHDSGIFWKSVLAKTEQGSLM